MNPRFISTLETISPPCCPYIPLRSAVPDLTGQQGSLVCWGTDPCGAPHPIPITSVSRSEFYIPPCWPGSLAAVQGTSFAVFGLGNRQYEHFCAVGTKVQKAMLALGASAVVANGEGDDDDDIEGDFDDWRAQLYEKLDQSLLVSKAKVTTGAVVPLPDTC